MKGQNEIVDHLNARLADELTAINQYVVHAEICANWGYGRLHNLIEKRAIDEMKHAEKLIERILYLDGIPTVNNLNAIHIGPQIDTQLANDWDAEETAIKSYNVSISLAVKLGDNGTREILESILHDEEVHVDWIEAQLDQIKQVNLQNYLAEQTRA